VKALLVHPHRLGTVGLTTFVLRLQEGLQTASCGALVLVAGNVQGRKSTQGRQRQDLTGHIEVTRWQNRPCTWISVLVAILSPQCENSS
jgi:hypothetical protein